MILSAPFEFSDHNFQPCIYGRDADIDPSPALAVRIYVETYFQPGPKRLGPFINSLSLLGPAFTELQVMNAAASCRMLPISKMRIIKLDLPFSFSSLPKFGEFVHIFYQDDQPVSWKRLGICHHCQDMVCHNQFKLDYCLP